MNKALIYAHFCVEEPDHQVPKYVKAQAREIIDIAEGRDPDSVMDEHMVTVVENITKITNQAEGEIAGQSMYQTLDGYQWLLIISVFCIVQREDPTRRRFNNVILEIGRKNYKTTTIAICLIILFMTSQRFSEFFSVAPSGKLSREVKKKLEKIIKSSPLLFLHHGKPRFDLLRDSIRYFKRDNVYYPLNYSVNKLDSVLPAMFLVDEAGALPDNSALESMRSGQITVKNPIGFVISTKYGKVTNPFEDEIAFAKQVLDGIVKRKNVLALLYEPDKTKNWMDDDNVIYQSNPAALNNSTLLHFLFEKRADAILRPALRSNYLTKHNNILYQGLGTESYIDVNYLFKCRTDAIDWRDREVYVGVDLAISVDNCAVVMVAIDDDGTLLIHPMAFFPEGRIDEKCKVEQIDYHRYVRDGQAIACGDLVVDYAVIEDYVFSLEEKFGVKILGIGYDRMNAMSSAQKWDQKYDCTAVRQHSDTLHMPTKLLEEKILNREVRYVRNQLYEINFENAKVVEDTNKNKYVHKKKSRGKVDMVMATLNALYLLQQEVLLADDDFIAQVI